MANTASMGMRFYASGTELVQQTYSQLAESGKRMWAGIAAGQDKVLPGMKAVNAASHEFSQGLQGMAANAGAFGRILSATGAAGIAVAAALGAVVIALRQTRGAMEFGDEIADTAEKIRTTTDELQEYRFAIHAVGGETTDADEGLKGFIERLGEARSGLSAKSLKPFAALGITKEDLQQFKNAGDAIPLIADKIAALGAEADQAAVAKRLGLEPLLPLLRQGAEGIEDLRRQARETGAVMDKDLVQRLGHSNDKFEQMSRVVDMQLKQAFTGLAPVLTGLMQLTANWLFQLNQVLDRFSSIENKSMDSLKTEEDQWRQQIEDLKSGKLSSSPLRNVDTAQAGLTVNLQEQWRRNNPNSGRGKRRKLSDIGAPGTGAALIDIDEEAKAEREAGRRQTEAEKRERERERQLAEVASQDQRFAAAMQALRDKSFAAHASEAATIDQRLRVELDRLAAASQAAAEDRARQVSRKELTQVQADQLSAEQARTDEAQRGVLQAQAANDRLEVANRFAADFAATQRDIVGNYARMSVTVRDREALERVMLDMEQARQRQALEARIVGDQNLSEADAAALRRQQGLVEDAQDQALAEQQSGLRVAVYGAWHAALGELLQGDIGGMFQEFFGDLADHFGNKLKDRLADAMFDLGAKLLSDLGGGGGIGDFIGKAVGWLTGGARAAGGPTVPGYAYRAAEHGTELAMIGRQGQVFSHQDTIDMLQDAAGGGQSGGGMVNQISFAPTYNVTGNGEDIAALRRQMERDKAEFPSKVVGSINDAFRRGMVSTVRA